MKSNLEFEVNVRFDGDTLGDIETTEENCKPLTELEVQKMFFLLREVEGYRLGVLDTQISIECDGDKFEIRSSPFDVWGGEDNEEGDVWGDECTYSGSLVELDKMNTYENRLVDCDRLDGNPMSVSFVYEVVDGVITDPDDDTHYGMNILSDEETIMVVRKLMDEGFVSNNENGMIEVYDDMIVIDVVGKEPILIPKK
jgi:hypothetical protein